MDLGDSGPWPVVLGDCLDRLLSFWHGYRLLIFTACVLLLLSLAAVRARRSQRPARNASPSSEEKSAWLEHTTGNTSKENIQIYPAKSVEPEPKKPAVARLAPRVVTGRRPLKESSVNGSSLEPNSIQPLIFFSSLTGTTERLSKDVAASFADLSKKNTSILPPQVHDLSYIDLDDYFISGAKTAATAFYILLIPSYDIDTIINTFLAHLDETHNDFRIDTGPLSQLAGYAVFGIGDKQGWPDEEAGFCSQAIQVDKWMAKLTGRLITGSRE
jgi:tRNA wybutosine-synthesizing protein 1